MNYFKYGDTNIYKYRVIFDKEEIEKLKLEIINKCSRIVHNEYIGHRFFSKVDNLKIRNLIRKKVGVQEFIDGPDEDIYRFSYDEYIYPSLVGLIDKLLAGDATVIDTIFDPGKISEHISFKSSIERVSAELDQIDNLDIDKKRKKLDELQKLVDCEKLNRNQKPVSEYYQKLQSLITLEFVESISTEEVSKVNSFFSSSKVKTKSLGGK